MFRLCKCGHRKYRHNVYPLDLPFCKGNDTEKYSLFGCLCCKYDPQDNLEWLEAQYNKLVSKNKKDDKV